MLFRKFHRVARLWKYGARKLADAEAKLEESKLAIASLQASKATLQNTLNESIQETDYCKQARLAFEEEICFHLVCIAIGRPFSSEQILIVSLADLLLIACHVYTLCFLGCHTSLECIPIPIADQAAK